MTVNSHNDAENHYYSGQGVVMIGERTAAGKPKGLRPIGNVTALAIAIAVTTLEHKESQSGQRATDLRIPTETKATLTLDLENYNARNLALALRGDMTIQPAASVTGESVPIYPGLVMPLAHMNVSAVVISSLTTYVDDSTPWDYKVNLDAGSLHFNDGTTTLIASLYALGTAITGVAVGATTDLTLTLPAAEVGSYLSVGGFTGADAAVLNGKSFQVVSNSGTHVVIAAVTTGKTITTGGSTKGVAAGTAVTVNYDYTLQYRVDAMTQGSPERYLRFEGLNTADNNSPVVVEAFRFQVDPLAERAFISDGLGKMTMTGNLLIDPLQLTGSKFFKETMLVA